MQHADADAPRRRRCRRRDVITYVCSSALTRKRTGSSTCTLFSQSIMPTVCVVIDPSSGACCMATHMYTHTPTHTPTHASAHMSVHMSAHVYARVQTHVDAQDHRLARLPSNPRHCANSLRLRLSRPHKVRATRHFPTGHALEVSLDSV